jgi:AcrR family transcriptional regulator
MEEGYASASMSAIAARVGGSKGTLYNYFASKEELFEAVVADACLVNAEAMFSGADEHSPLAETLFRIGRSFLGFVLADDAMALHRVVVAEAHRFPELGRVFFESGPRLSQSRLADLLERYLEQGALRDADPEVSAAQFFSLCKGHLHLRVLCNVGPPPTPEQVDGHVENAVRTFVAAYGAVLAAG